MAAVTNNGWPKDPSLTRIFVGGDRDGCEVRSGDVAKAFTWFLTQIQNRVEPLVQVHGARTSAYNISVGGAPGSNHVSGTAVDVNGYKHPYEIRLPASQRYGNYRHGWTTAQIREIRRIISESGGRFAWGLDYAAPYRDAMHFDIAKGVSAASLAAFVKQITPAPTPTPPTPTPAPPPVDPLGKFLKETAMSIPRYYKVDGTQLAWEDLGTARRATSKPQYDWTRARYPAGTVEILALPAYDPFWLVPIQGPSTGELLQQQGSPALWFLTLKDGVFGREWVDGPEYVALGKPPFTVVPANNILWNLPVFGEDPNKKG